MTLRIISDNEHAGSAPYCQIGCSGISRPEPATILVSINGQPYLPACDGCARQVYQWAPQHVRMAPLSEYVDMFAAAKAAALATPEQITSAHAETDGMICRRMYEDRVIYCREPWCEKSGQVTPAEVMCDLNGQTRVPACSACARERQSEGRLVPLRVEIYPLDEQAKAEILAQMDQYAREKGWNRKSGAVEHAAKKRKASYAPALMIMISSSVLFITGLAVAIMSTAPGPGIWLAILAGLGFFAGFFVLVHEAEAPYRAWKAGLSPENRRRVELGEAAAAVAATAAVAYDIHRRHERGRERLAASNAAFAQRQRDATQQAILGELRQLNAPAAPCDPVAAMHDRRKAANLQGDSNPLLRNGWS